MEKLAVRDSSSSSKKMEEICVGGAWVRLKLLPISWICDHGSILDSLSLTMSLCPKMSIRCKLLPMMF
ncbi:hypothetical protein A4A49_00238 [Nicotiana attenuata]|uniref:Uncharacterized protein n=1 Tax=Nicotiana attenuata TaxID=49451 RepID=A0A314LDI1_NICAT|nr:hypothetical protein A4A49_00238 [Nicotiana attenuata]